MQGSAGLCLVVLVGLWGCVTPGSPVSGGHRSGMRLAASGGGGVGAVRAPAAAAASLYLRGGSDAGGGVETVEKQGRRAALDPTGGLYPLPSFVKHRLAVLERAKARIAAAAAASSCAPSPRHITITLPDGATRNGHAFVTCPSTVANGISKQLALGSVVAVVDGNLWDMTRPLEESCALEFLTFDDPRAQKVFWHSSAHILGQALEICKNALLATGPPTEDGFFYDVYLPAQADTPAAELPETRGDSAAATGGDILLDASGRAWDGGPEGRVISSDELPELEQIIANISRQNQAFERVELTKDEALDMFQHNPFKLAIIRDKVPDGATCSAYRCGPLIDLCRGPHLPHSGMVKAVSLTKNSAAYWKGRGDSVVLQRVYGVAFPAKKQLKEHLQWREDAKRRDHRIIGRAQGLFFFHELSPGAAFFLPHGTIIYNRLVEMIRAEYARRNYLEVITPTLFNLKLWQTSGHAEHYRKNMFLLSSGAGKAPPPADKQPSAQGDSAGLGEVASKVRAMGVQWDQDAEGSRTAAVGAEEDTMRCEVRGRAGDGEGAESEEFGLKPMNCPGHCLIFGATVRSYRELPLRLADFGVLHRNEPAGALAGLTRVRRFQQDDAHIFCAPGQVQAEIENVLDFIDEVYTRKFNLSYDLSLSTRPETYIGARAQWDDAEEQLRRALDARVSMANQSYATKAGDGAFYGPKIDITVVDSLRRRHQCATIQLDFQLPQRFNLSYSAPAPTPVGHGEKDDCGEEEVARAVACGGVQGGDGYAGQSERPVIIHRAVLGSVERLFALLTEHTGGKWPLWLSPRQVSVVPVSADQHEYARTIEAALRRENLHADADVSSNTLNKKIRTAQVAQYNYILVVGRDEQVRGTVNVRTRDNVVHGEKTLAELTRQLKNDIAAYR